jgi:hypothetical protein
LDVEKFWKGRKKQGKLPSVPARIWAGLIAHIQRSCCSAAVSSSAGLGSATFWRSPGALAEATVNQKSWPDPCTVSKGVERGKVSMVGSVSATPILAAFARYTGVAPATGCTAHVVVV